MDIREALAKIQESVDKALELVAGECRKVVEQVEIYFPLQESPPMRSSVFRMSSRLT